MTRRTLWVALLATVALLLAWRAAMNARIERQCWTLGLVVHHTDLGAVVCGPAAPTNRYAPIIAP